MKLPYPRFLHTLSVLLLLGFIVGGTAAERDFVHPGLLHSRSDLDRMKVAVAAKADPIYAGFKVLTDSPRSRADYRRRGPFPEFGRAPTIRMGEARSDGDAAYQNALMWAITGKQAHADKAIEILDAWAGSLKKVTGIDGVLAAGIEGFKYVNAAELLRHTDSGWPEENAKRCEKWFMETWHPTIEHYAHFANGNWETAALQTKMAIAVYCNDRRLFEETVRYAIAGAGNGSIPHTVVFPSGQCQESSRAQHYAQLGLGYLACAAEIAWNQGVDLYGWGDNRILAGFEYCAKYGLGEDVVYQPYLDRTGQYGIGGHHKPYTKISTISRGDFYPIFERPFNHYVNRRNLPAPFSARVVEKKRPEGHSGDHVGLGTLTHWRPPFKAAAPLKAPGIPAGLLARSTDDGLRISWVGSVEPVSCTDATSYSVHRSTQSGGPYKKIATQLSEPVFHDKNVRKGTLSHYVITASNAAGTSPVSTELAASAGLPGPFLTTDIGDVAKTGYSEFNGERFTLEGEGHDIGGTEDSFHFAYAPMSGEGTITARIIRPMSSQWTKPGVMMRESLDADSRHASVLLLPHWSGALVTRSEKGGETSTGKARHLGEKHVIKNNRLSTPYWVRLIRFRNRFTGYMSPDGYRWQELGSVEIPMSHTFYVGLPACSQLDKVTTTVTYDRVSIPTWRTPPPDGSDKLIAGRPEPRWHKKPWLERHLAMNERVKKGNLDLLMIGDSITHWWDKEGEGGGKEIWDQYYKKRNAVNLAISGDRTEHVLWRLENGNIDGISPKLAVLMIGTNNHSSSPAEVTARDIRLIVAKLRRKLPETKVLVLGIFPRGGNDDDTARQKNMTVNQLIANIGDDDEKVHYQDIGDAFLDGRRIRGDLIPDGSHPNQKGYAAWAEAMEPVIAQLLEETIPADLPREFTDQKPFHQVWDEEVPVMGHLAVAVDGTVLIFKENREEGRVDTKRSEDGGKTWGELIEVGKRAKIDADMSDDGRYKGEHVGWSELANIAVDENNGDILVFAAGLKPAQVVYRSRDHGKTWKTEEIEIRPDKNGWQATTYCCDPGITLRQGKHKGRLLMPAQVFVGSINADGSRTYLNKGQGRKYFDKRYSSALFSDDGGKTWNHSAPFPILGTSEPGLVELNDGRIYYNARTHVRPGNKIVGHSEDGGQTWSDSAEDDELFDGPPDVYGCKGAILRLPSDDHDILLFSGPGRRDERNDITVQVSFDGGQSWPVKRVIKEGPGNYTWMAAGRKGTPSESMIYLLANKDWMARFNLTWLLEAQDE
jgi:lysophospholipase L1-like esterase